MCFNESSPNSSCQFWNRKVKVYSNFASLFSFKKNNSSVFFLAQTSIIWTKRNFQTFEWLSEHSPNFLCHVCNYMSVFLWTLYQSLVPWEITLLYFFSWNCTWFGQKEPIKVQNFRPSTAHVKFHQICTLIGSHCVKSVQIRSYFWSVFSCIRIEGKLICCFKNDKNLVNFDPSTQKSQKFALWLVPIVQSI